MLRIRTVYSGQARPSAFWALCHGNQRRPAVLALCYSCPSASQPGASPSADGGRGLPETCPTSHGRGPLGSRGAREPLMPSCRRSTRVVARDASRAESSARGRASAPRTPPSPGPGRASSRPPRAPAAAAPRLPSSLSSLPARVAALIPAKPRRRHRPRTESRARSPHGCGRSGERKELAGRRLLPLSAKGRAQAPLHVRLPFRSALSPSPASDSVTFFLKICDHGCLGSRIGFKR